MKKSHKYGYRLAAADVNRDLGKWKILRTIGKTTISTDAQLKLEWIIFYHTLGNKKVLPTAKHFGIAPKTLHKWLNRFEEKNLYTLEEHSRKPDHVRVWMVTREEEQNIIHLRKAHMLLGKKKLQVLYQQTHGVHISTWKIERVIRYHKLYIEKNKQAYLVEKRAKNKAKVRIHTMKDTIKQIHEFGFLWHIDAIIIWWYGTRRIIFTAIEQHTRITYAHVYSSNTSTFATDFLQRLNYVTGEKIRIMHSDNGSEFQGNFAKACQTLGILQVYSRAYTPKTMQYWNDSTEPYKKNG
jgi:transposase-like protein